MTMHEDEVVLAHDIGRALIASQFPQWAQERIRRIDSSGTVNAIFRIGERYAARFPLLVADPDEMQRRLEAEARASGEFPRASPFPAPEPAGLGRPGDGYPLPWSVQTWLPGTDASQSNFSGSEAFCPRPRRPDHQAASRRHLRPHLHRRQPRRRPT
jgi:aminoglycoside phosphotransferase (APT) family kinase protein